MAECYSGLDIEYSFDGRIGGSDVVGVGEAHLQLRLLGVD